MSGKELLLLVSPDSSDVSTPLITGGNMSSQPANTSRFKVEAAVLETPVVEEPSHSANGTQPTLPPPAKVDIRAPLKLMKTPREIKLKFTVMCLFVLILIGTILILVYYKEEPLQYTVGSLTYYVDNKEMVIKFEGLERLRGEMGLLVPSGSPATCSIPGSDETLCLNWRDYGKLRINYNTDLTASEIDCYEVSWQTYAPENSIKDCFSIKNSHWYGGSVKKSQNLPLESMNIPLTAFITSDREDQFGSVVERYWLSTRNVTIKVADGSPLLVSIDKNNQDMCLESKYWDSIHHHHNKSESHLEYKVCTNSHLVELFNRTKSFPIPQTIPDTLFLSDPVWSLDVDNATSPYQVMGELGQFHPRGLVDIRSGFGAREGDLTFKDSQYNASFVPYVQGLGMKVSAGVTPFVSVESRAFKDGTHESTLVNDPRGEVPGLTTWDNDIGGVIDFTDNNALLLYKNSLAKFKQSQGFDFLTFDYGEASYLPYGYQIDTELNDPSEFTERYIKNTYLVVDTVITRSAYQNQGDSIIIRTYPKEASWDMENGYASIAPSVVNLGLMGYPFMALDIRVSDRDLMGRELFIAYMQLSACLPVMQIPTDLFRYNKELKDVVKTYIEFHRNTIAPLVTRLSEVYLAMGLPIIRPVWWVENNSQTAPINSEFLVGDDLLVAPSTAPGQGSRQVYLPRGKWFQPGTGVLYQGGQWREVVFHSDDIPYLTRS